MRRRVGFDIGVVLAALVLAATCGRPAPEPPAARPLSILITNDDGIEAPGIAAVAEALRPLGTVTVAAPDRGRSGSSHGVTSDRSIAVRESDRGGQRWIALDALPPTCVRLAVDKLLAAKPDLVVSGINAGENLGAVTFYSATVGAAREAALLGLPAIAVNLGRGDGMDYRRRCGGHGGDRPRPRTRRHRPGDVPQHQRPSPAPGAAPGRTPHPAGHQGPAPHLREGCLRRRHDGLPARMGAPRAGRPGHRHLGGAQRIRLDLRVRHRPVGRGRARGLSGRQASRAYH